MSLTEREIEIARIAFANGYGYGNNDTVEGSYHCDEQEKADDWISDATQDGTFDDVAPEGVPNWNCLTDAQKDEAIRKAMDCSR